MNNNYLIPANAKKSQLILGFFTPLDLGIFITGCALSLGMLLLINTNSIVVLILMLLPGLISAFLVTPVIYYHNILQLLTNIFNFYLNTRRYYWKGWSIYEKFGDNDK